MVAASTARKIATAARRLLEKEGAEAVSMRRVAEAVGVTAMAIYRHYPDRAALLNAVADEGFEELATILANKRFSGGFEERLAKMADVYLDHALNHPALYDLMFLAKREGARRYPRDFKAGRSPTFNPTVQVLEEGMDGGHFAKDDALAITFEMSALSHGLILLYLGGRIDATPARFRTLYRNSFRRYFRGIRS
ncbi:MAG TPA: TetR/AcrR family transcriptional regulator [Polyangiaceae bacterium]|nr:TetR/AcrR family transcriptional regulator [Polyangiaceae bacterium]